MVDHVPPLLPPPPEPQDEAAKETKPLLSVWRHRIPDPPKLVTVRLVREPVVPKRLVNVAVVLKRSVEVAFVVVE